MGVINLFDCKDKIESLLSDNQIETLVHEKIQKI